MRKNVLVTAIIVVLSIAGACSEDEQVVEPDPYVVENPTITVTGSLSIAADEDVPQEGEYLRIVWGRDTDEGAIGYVAGESTIDWGDGTFTLDLETPPDSVMYYRNDAEYPPICAGRIVYGQMIAPEPHYLVPDENTGLLGAVIGRGVVYIGGDPQRFADHPKLSWAANMKSGMNLADGIEAERLPDIFLPADTTQTVLTIQSHGIVYWFPIWHFGW